MGKFGIIFTRRQLLYLVMVLAAMMAIYLFVLVEESHNHEIGKHVDCGTVLTLVCFSTNLGRCVDDV